MSCPRPWAAPSWRGARRRSGEAILDDLRKSDEPHDRLAAHPDKVAQLIEETCARGYATRHPGYFVNVRREALVSAIAVPVLSQGRVIAAVNLSWVLSAQSEAEFAAAHLEALRDVAQEIASAWEEGQGRLPAERRRR